MSASTASAVALLLCMSVRSADACTGSKAVRHLFNRTENITGKFDTMSAINKFEAMITAEPKQRVGEQVGDYRLIRWLGRGTFADVYLGEHIYLKTQSAIKVLHLHLPKKVLKDFLNEACTVAGLDHPNIVRVLDYGVENRIPFLAMAYAPNGSLRQRFPEGTRVSLEQIVPLVQQIASALDYAHQQRLIHRDVKPENMLLGPQNQVLLSDFGFVLVAQDTRSQAANAMVGTALYMAPEMVEGKVHFASDQYALGIVTYQWLCGEYPFTGSYIQIGTQHLLVPPPSLCEKVPGLPPDVERVVFKALAKDRAQRYENVTAFANALQDVCKDPASISATNLVPQLPSSSSKLSLQPAETSFLPIETLPEFAETLLEPDETSSEPAEALTLPEAIKPTQPSRPPGDIWRTVLVVVAIVSVIAASVRLWYNITSSPASMQPSAQAVTIPVVQPAVDVTSIPTAQLPTSTPTPTPRSTPTSTVTPSTSYEAEAPNNTNNGTKVFNCNLCSGGLRVGWISYSIFLQFNNVNVNHDGNYTLTIYYLNSIPNRVTSAFVSVNGGPNVEIPGIQVLTVNCCDNIPPQVTQMTVHLQRGNNTIKLSSPADYAPDIDRIVVG